MGFIEVAQGWLRERAERDAEPVLPPDFDMAHRQAVMWEALRRLSGDAQREAHQRWSAEGYLERFVTEVIAGLRSGIGAVKKPSTYAWLADAAIRAAVRGTEVTEREAGGTLVKFELDRVISAVKVRTAEMGRFAVDIPEWCRAVSMVGEDGTPSATGRAFLSLVGREAVLFALELEVALSTGFADALRVSHATLEELASASLTIEQGEQIVDNRIFYDYLGNFPGHLTAD